MKKLLSIVLLLVLVFALPSAAYADVTYWENIFTGDVIVRTARPSQSELDYLRPHTHSFGEWYVQSIPTCMNTGLKIRTCYKCGYRETAAIDRIGHSYGPWTVLQKPSCVNYGIQEQVCVICGYRNRVQMEMIPHEFTKWFITVGCTDHSAGVKQSECDMCELITYVSYDPLGTFKLGDEGKEVKEMQRKLCEQGFLDKKYVDGRFWTQTEEAVREFQEAVGIEADGIAWPQTVKMLDHDYGEWVVVDEGSYDTFGIKQRTCKDCGFTQSKTIGYKIMDGDHGDEVADLQKALMANGYNPGSIDGRFGASTKKAIKEYQEAMGYPVDGICWPGIYRELVG